MADPNFFTRAGPFSLGAIAQAAEAHIHEQARQDIIIEDVATLFSATIKDISFFDNPKYRDAFRQSDAGACICHPKNADQASTKTSLILSEYPYYSYAKAARAFYPSHAYCFEYGHISPSAEIGEGCHIAPTATICERAKIGNGSFIGANVVIAPSVVISQRCHIGNNVTIEYSLVGNDVHIGNGSRIGQDGFGFAPHPKDSGYVRVPQLGRTIIKNFVHIGANTTIDRGSGPDTVIGEGCQIDNLVQIAHNVVLGKDCIVAAQVGISGSTTIGDYTAIGGQAGITGHLSIGKYVSIAAQSGVMRDITDGMAVSGSPAIPAMQWRRQSILLSGLTLKAPKSSNATG